MAFGDAMETNATIAPTHSDSIITVASTHWPAAAISIGLLLLTWISQWYFRKDELAGIPVVDAGGRLNQIKQFFGGGGAWERYEEGLETESIAVPPHLLPELKRLPDDVLSIIEASNETMQAKYTQFDTDIPTLPHTLKTALTPALSRLNDILADEVRQEMSTDLPQSTKWEEVNINDKMLRIVAIASGRIFVGPELCRDKAYLETAINYTIDLMIAVFVVSLIPLWIRPAVGPWLPPVRKVMRRIREANDFLQPVVAARRKAVLESPDYEKPNDMLQWILDSHERFGTKGDDELAKMQLILSFAAIHTTTLTITNAFYTLAVMPDVVPQLRKDVEDALADAGGKFTNQALTNMKKVDSFIKEVMRCYPLSTSSFQRKVLKPITLSNGQVIPPGYTVEVPAGGIYTDAEIFPDPRKFDPFRFSKLREAEYETTKAAAEAEASGQFVGVSPSSLTFGYGRHACPGRFYAANEIKMILAISLLHYEIKMPDGIDGRYPNKRIGQQQIPNADKKIMVRKVR